MTTGTFTLRPISSITILREERQRRDLVNIPELAESISKHGLIHPILIDRSFQLVAGERRLEACKSLGWTTIQCQFTDELEPSALQELELEENIRRADISWQDQCRAIERYHNLRRESDLTWSQVQTAAALGISQPSLNDKMAVAAALSEGNKRVTEAPKYSVAKGIVQRDKERRQTSTISAIVGGSAISSIITADFTEWAAGYGGEQYNFIHCDFPYGIGADKFDQGSGSAHGVYADDQGTYARLLEALGQNLRIISPSAHIMFWFSMKHYQYTYETLCAQGWWIDPVPLTWQKSDNTGILSDPSRRPRYTTEFCLYGSRGDRKIVQAVANGCSMPTEPGGHMSVKPVPVLRHFMRMFVDDTTNALDPTCGSGGAIKAIRGLAGKATGIEINPEFADIARRNVDGTN